MSLALRGRLVAPHTAAPSYYVHSFKWRMRATPVSYLNSLPISIDLTNSPSHYLFLLGQQMTTRFFSLPHALVFSFARSLGLLRSSPTARRRRTLPLRRGGPALLADDAWLEEKVCSRSNSHGRLRWPWMTGAR